MSDIGIKVSQENQNVQTAPPVDLVYSSQFQTLKTFMSGYNRYLVPAHTGTWPNITPGHVSVIIAHSLNYKAAFMVFSTNVAAGRDVDKYSPYASPAVGGPSPSDHQYSSLVNQLRIELYNPTGVEIEVFLRYHIFYNKIE